MYRFLLTIVSGVIALYVGGCANIPAVEHLPRQADASEPRMLVVFMDGTRNDEGSYTNVSKLHQLVMLQPDTNIRTAYVAGVGTGYRIGGMATGLGFGADVREAFLFLAENYRSEKGDKIYIFGFSRGAYAARVLAGLIYVAGLPDLSQYPPDAKSASLGGNQLREYQKSKRMDFVRKIYAAHKGANKTIFNRRNLVRAVMDEERKDFDFKIADPDQVKIQFMGLWDTVEALAFPDYEENIQRPSALYVDQLCNVEAAAQALSIDDDRARIFTPLLLTLPHLKKCRPVDDRKDEIAEFKIDGKVKEVWFSGAHSDVGGGYRDTEIDGVSLNWMIKQIKKVNTALLPEKTKVYGDPFGKTHDPEKSMGIFYQKLQRDLPCYAKLTNKDSSDKTAKLTIHRSVFDRLAKIPVQNYEFKWMGGEQYDGHRGKYKNCLGEEVETKEDFRQCFTEVPGVVNGKSVNLLKLNESQSCFTIEEPDI